MPVVGLVVDGHLSSYQWMEPAIVVAGLMRWCGSRGNGQLMMPSISRAPAVTEFPKGSHRTQLLAIAPGSEQRDQHGRDTDNGHNEE